MAPWFDGGMTTLILLNSFLALGIVAGLAALMRLPFHLAEPDEARQVQPRAKPDQARARVRTVLATSSARNG